MTHRTRVKIILADNFYPQNDAEILYNVTLDLNYEETDYGWEVPQFNWVQAGVHEVCEHVIGEPLVMDKELSGSFRKPMHGIHFEGFRHPDEWCFVVSLDYTECVFNYYKHMSGAQNALEGYKFSYKNLFEWQLEGSIILKRNQGVFFRPWMFHSMEHGLVQYFRFITVKADTELKEREQKENCDENSTVEDDK